MNHLSGTWNTEIKDRDFALKELIVLRRGQVSRVLCRRGTYFPKRESVKPLLPGGGSIWSAWGGMNMFIALYIQYSWPLNIMGHTALAHFSVRIQHIIHRAYKICQLTMLSVRLLVSSRLFVVKFLESWKLFVDFWLHRCWSLGYSRVSCILPLHLRH